LATALKTTILLWTAVQKTGISPVRIALARPGLDIADTAPSIPSRSIGTSFQREDCVNGRTIRKRDKPPPLSASRHRHHFGIRSVPLSAPRQGQECRSLWRLHHGRPELLLPQFQYRAGFEA